MPFKNGSGPTSGCHFLSCCHPSRRRRPPNVTSWGAVTFSCHAVTPHQSNDTWPACPIEVPGGGLRGSCGGIYGAGGVLWGIYGAGGGSYEEIYGVGGVLQVNLWGWGGFYGGISGAGIDPMENLWGWRGPTGVWSGVGGAFVESPARFCARRTTAPIAPRGAEVEDSPTSGWIGAVLPGTLSVAISGATSGRGPKQDGDAHPYPSDPGGEARGSGAALAVFRSVQRPCARQGVPQGPARPGRR